MKGQNNSVKYCISNSLIRGGSYSGFVDSEVHVLEVGESFSPTGGYLKKKDYKVNCFKI